jgi:hypothetical protein
MHRIVVSTLVLGLLTILPFGAGNVWAGDCGGAGPACVCGDTVTQDHTLPPLTCNGDGLIVDVGIILDLGGNDLTGTDQKGTGVKLRDGAHVLNGRILNFDIGIGQDGAIDSCFIGTDTTGLVVTINHTGIELEANGCTIVKTGVVANVSDGVSLKGDDNALTQNTCSRNGGDGISIEGDHNTLTSNRCELNRGHGIAVTGDVNTLERNLGGRNDGSGILVDGSENVFKRNQGRTNDGDGVRGTGTDLATDGRNYGIGNGGVNCEIDGHDSTGGGKYC